MAKTRRFGKAEVEVSINDRVRKGLAAIEDRMKRFGAGLTKIGGSLAGVGGVAATGLIAMTKSFQAFGDSIQKAGLRVGVGAQALTELKFAAEQSGTSIDQLSQAMFRSGRRIANASTGTGPAVRALESLGLSAEKLNQLDSAQQLEVIADALGRVGNDALAAQFGFEIFGDNFRQIKPLLDEGSDGIRRLRGEARDLGITLSQEDADAAAAFGDALNRAKQTVGAVAMQIGAALAPMLTRAADVFAKVAVVVTNFVKNNRGLVQVLAGVVAGITALGTTLVAAGGAMIALGSAASAVAAIFTPMGAIIAGVSAALATIGGLFIATAVKTGSLSRSVMYLKDLFKSLQPIFAQVSRGIGNALSSGNIKLAAQILFAGLEVVFYKGAQQLLRTVTLMAAEMAMVMIKLRDDIATGRIFFGGSQAGSFLGGGFLDNAEEAQARLDALTEQARREALAQRNRGPRTRIGQLGAQVGNQAAAAAIAGGAGRGRQRPPQYGTDTARNTGRMVTLMERMQRRGNGFR